MLSCFVPFETRRCPGSNRFALDPIFVNRPMHIKFPQSNRMEKWTKEIRFFPRLPKCHSNERRQNCIQFWGFVSLRVPRKFDPFKQSSTSNSQSGLTIRVALPGTSTSIRYFLTSCTSCSVSASKGTNGSVVVEVLLRARWPQVLYWSHR